MSSCSSTSNPQSSRTDASASAQARSPGASGTRVGFLESILIRARASATASPRGTTTFYLLFALPEAFGFDFAAAFTGCFLAAFIVGFFTAALTGAACLVGVWLAGDAWWAGAACEACEVACEV